MKVTFIVFISVLLCCTVRGADKRHTRAEALAQLQSAGKNSQVVFVGKLEMRSGRRVLVFLDVLKSSKGLPAAGELRAPQRSGGDATRGGSEVMICWDQLSALIAKVMQKA